MTDEIGKAIKELLCSDSVGVGVEAEHSCINFREVNVPRAKLTTTSLLGVVRNDRRTSEEFLRLTGSRSLSVAFKQAFTPGQTLN